jgi:hypothetical protein
MEEFKGLIHKAYSILKRLTLELGVEDGSTQVQSVTYYTTIWLNASMLGSPSFGIRPS